MSLRSFKHSENTFPHPHPQHYPCQLTESITWLDGYRRINTVIRFELIYHRYTYTYIRFGYPVYPERHLGIPPASGPVSFAGFTPSYFKDAAPPRVPSSSSSAIGAGQRQERRQERLEGREGPPSLVTVLGNGSEFSASASSLAGKGGSRAKWRNRFFVISRKIWNEMIAFFFSGCSTLRRPFKSSKAFRRHRKIVTGSPKKTFERNDRCIF